MTWHRERSLWSSAILGSVIIHAALGAALALAPATEEVEKRETVITIHSIPEGFSQQAEASSEATPSKIALNEVSAAVVTDIASIRDRPEPLTPASEAQDAKVARASGISEIVESTAIVAALEPAAALPRAVDDIHVARSAPAVGAGMETVAEAVEAQPIVEGVRIAPTLGIASSMRPVDAARDVPSPIPPTSAVGLRDQSVVSALVAAPISAPSVSPSSPQARPAPFAVVNPVRPAAAEQGTAVVPVGAKTQIAVAVRPDAPLIVAPRETVEDVLARVSAAIDGARERLGECVIAKPVIASEQVSVESFAVANAAFEQLSAAVADASFDVVVQRRPVAERQCAALAFAAENSSELVVELTNSDIASGSAIRGKVNNISRKWFYLLTVDGDGLVQEVDKSQLSDGGMGSVSFAAPITLTGLPGETVQLIVTVASDEILETVYLLNGAQAETFFPRLSAEFAQAGMTVDVGLAAFTLR